MLIDGTLEGYGRGGRTWDQDLPNDSQVLYVAVIRAEKFEHPTKLSVHFSFFDLANQSLKYITMLVSNVTEPESIDAFL